MLGLVFLFLLIAIVAGILGFTNTMVASRSYKHFCYFPDSPCFNILMNLLRSMDSQ